MSRVQIKVGDSLLDTFSDLDDLFYITKQLNDLHNLQNRQADFTRDIDIPRTNNNSALLNLLSNERIGNESFSCDLIIDGILQIPSGRLIITKEYTNTISIVLLGGNFELFDNLPDDSVKALNFSAYSFPWTFAGIAGIQANTEGCTNTITQFLNEDSLDNGTGTIANFVNYIDIKNYGFVFYYKTLIKEIIEQSGYILDDSLLTSNDDYNDIFIACPIILPGSTEDVVSGIVERTSTYTYSALTAGGAAERIPFTVFIDPSGLWDAGNNEFIVPTTGNWLIVFDFTITNDNGSGEGPAQIEILNNGSNIEAREFGLVISQAETMTNTITATALDNIYIEVTGNLKNSALYDTIQIDIGARFILQENTPDPTGSVNVSDWIPDINQKQAVLDFLKILNLSINSNPFSREAKLIPFDNIINDDVQDLTNNVDISIDPSNEISMQGYYRQSEMSYIIDSDVKRTDTDQTVNFESDESLPLMGNILQVGFSPSDDDGLRMNVGAASLGFRSVSGFSVTAPNTLFTFAKDETFKPGDYIRYVGAVISQDRIDRIRFVNTKRAGQVYDNYTVTLTNVDVEIIEINNNDLIPRIGMINRSSLMPASLTINGYQQVNSQTGVDVNRSYFNLQMNRIYTNYYNKLFTALQTPKILVVWMVFNTVEFYNLDLLKPVKIDGIQGSFYINKIEQWKLNQPCLVELIRINPLI